VVSLKVARLSLTSSEEDREAKRTSQRRTEGREEEEKTEDRRQTGVEWLLFFY
jgi:hypothetical protein